MRTSGRRNQHGEGQCGIRPHIGAVCDAICTTAFAPRPATTRTDGGALVVLRSDPIDGAVDRHRRTIFLQLRVWVIRLFRRAMRQQQLLRNEQMRIVSLSSCPVSLELPQPSCVNMCNICAPNCWLSRRSAFDSPIFTTHPADGGAGGREHMDSTTATNVESDVEAHG